MRNPSSAELSKKISKPRMDYILRMNLCLVCEGTGGYSESPCEVCGGAGTHLPERHSTLELPHK